MTWPVVSFLSFTLLVAAVSYWYTGRERMDSSAAYFLGGRSLTAWVIAGSLILTNLSTEHLIGLNGDAFNHTIAVMAWETTAALAMVLMALYFLPRYLKMGLSTIPQYLEARYDTTTRVIAAVIFLFSYVLAILPVVLLFGAAGLDSLFDVSGAFGLSPAQTTWFLVWTVGTLGSLYAIFGGLKAVAISDTVNGVGFLIAGLLIPALALMQVGDGNAWAGLVEVYTAERPKFDITGDEPGSFLPFWTLFTGMIVNQIFFWCANQSIIQRGLGAKNLAEAQKGYLIAAAFKLLGPFIIVLPGVIAFHMFKDTLGPEDYLIAYPTLVNAVLPEWLRGFLRRRDGRGRVEHVQQCAQQLGDPVQRGRLSNDDQPPGAGPPHRLRRPGVQHRAGRRLNADRADDRHQRQPLRLPAADQRDVLRPAAGGDSARHDDQARLGPLRQDRPDRRACAVLSAGVGVRRFGSAVSARALRCIR